MHTLVLLASLAASAQQPAPNPEPLLVAIRLPVVAADLRTAGVPDAEVKGAVAAARDQKLPAAEATEALESAGTAVQAHGPIDNFGAFVQEKLAAGLRGKDLAAAIQAEHQARGKGQGAGKAPEKEAPKTERGASREDVAAGKGARKTAREEQPAGRDAAREQGRSGARENNGQGN